MSTRIPISQRDYTGKKFGRLTAVDRISEHGKPTKWRFRCDCGNEVEINIYSVLSGLTKSCGCIRRERGHTVHGGRYERLHGVWANMLTRCYNEKAKAYKNYGGRGIGVCDEWRNDGYPEIWQTDVNHIDCNKENNRPENLEWCSRKKNMQAAVRAGIPIGKYKRLAKPRNVKKPVIGFDANGTLVERFESISAAMHAGYNNVSIAVNSDGKRTCGGLTWRYA